MRGIYPAPKVRTVIQFDGIKNLHTQTDINNAMTDLFNDVGSEALSIEEGNQIAKMIEIKANSIQVYLHEELIKIQKQVGIYRP